MKTIGETLKGYRLKKRYSKERIAKETKIKEGFVDAIEKENWDKLPEFPVVLGFVKSIAHVLKVSDKNAAALLRRDYPPKEIRVSPKPDLGGKFKWGPRSTFLLGISLVVVTIMGYLVFEYFKFVSPPKLIIIEPKENVAIQNPAQVKGETEADATIRANNQPVIVDENGNFEAEIEINEETQEIVVIATSRSGKETVVRRKIELAD